MSLKLAELLALLPCHVIGSALAAAAHQMLAVGDQSLAQLTGEHRDAYEPNCCVRLCQHAFPPARGPPCSSWATARFNRCSRIPWLHEHAARPTGSHYCNWHRSQASRPAQSFRKSANRISALHVSTIAAPTDRRPYGPALTG